MASTLLLHFIVPLRQAFCKLPEQCSVMLQLREAAVAAMIRAQQEKAKPQAQPPSLEERASGKPAGKKIYGVQA